MSEINALLMNVVTEIRKENNDSGTCDDNKSVNCAGTSNVVKENKDFECEKEKNDEVGFENVYETDENNKGVSFGATYDAVKENNDVVGSENDSETGDDSKCVSSGATSDAVKADTVVVGSEHITTIQSSIVDTVMTRVDRKKKRKASMFVTPPSSTPRPNRKGKKLV